MILLTSPRSLQNLANFGMTIIGELILKEQNHFIRPHQGFVVGT